jgi:hypothetical protein
VVTPLPGDRCNELMCCGVVRSLIEERLGERLGLLDMTFAQCGERCVDCIGAPALVVRRLRVHVKLPPAFSRSRQAWNDTPHFSELKCRAQLIFAANQVRDHGLDMGEPRLAPILIGEVDLHIV